MKREDFPILETGIIYYDNAATTLKPKQVIESINDYYYYPANIHRGDYDNAVKISNLYEDTRNIVKEYINAKSSREIVFTSGATDSLNRIAFGYFNYLKEDDEVLLTKSEHASNILPWHELGVNVKYIPLDNNYEVTLDNIRKVVTNKTKVISLAYITNVIGDVRPIKEIIEYAHELGILVVVDAAQAISHLRIDVRNLDVDFLAFSGHKMGGPTGIGVLYAKEKLLINMRPMFFGGGMNVGFTSDGVRIYEDVPWRHEAGTPNIAGVLGLRKAIMYLNDIGLEKIADYELSLKKYAVSSLEKNPNIVIYNPNSTSGIIAFNYRGLSSQELAIYLNKYNIAVRSGSHCAKVLSDEIGINNVCRISFCFYNTKEEIDKLVRVLNKLG